MTARTSATDVARAALRAAAGRRIPLLWTADPGVVSGCLSGCWCVDERHRPRGVNLIGALLLGLQEAPVDDETPVDTAARALGVTSTWVEAANDGWCMEGMDFTVLTGVRRQLYLTAYEQGVLLRHELSRACGCGTRVLKPAEMCDGCADAARDAADALEATP